MNGARTPNCDGSLLCRDTETIEQSRVEESDGIQTVFLCSDLLDAAGAKYVSLRVST